MPANRPSPSSVAPAVTRDVTAFLRTLVTAARAQVMYERTHPAAVAAADRCRVTIGPLAAHENLIIGITPETLLINGDSAPADSRIREACALLNDHDIVSLRILTQPSAVELSNFLMLLSFDVEAIRHRGGPAGVWQHYGHYWLHIGQIDYDTLLAGATPGTVAGTARAGDAGPAPRNQPIVRDLAWQNLVRTMADGRGAIEPQAERRLLDIAQSPEAICALAADAADTQGGEGAAREAAQAAAVLMTFQRLSSFVEMHTPHDVETALRNIADAAAQTDPARLMRAVSEAAESGLGVDVVKAIGERFNDDQVADLLAAALATEGKASARMAAALNTLTVDDSRRERVLRLARARTGGPAPSGDVSSLWLTLERFLEGPADAAYVSRLYGESLEQVEARSNRLRLDAPAKLDEWMRSVSAESVRTLSATVLIDLFSLERNPGEMLETAKDLAALTDDLLVASDVEEAARVTEELGRATAAADPERASAASAALADVLCGQGLREALSMAGELDSRQYEALERLCRSLGPGVAAGLVAALGTLAPGDGRRRLEALLQGFREQALDALADAIDATDAEHAREFIRVVGAIGGARATTLLHTWARSPRPDLAREAVHGLIVSQEAAAGQALAALLRTGEIDARAAVVEAVASSHHTSAGRLLGDALRTLDPLGHEHELCLRMLSALRLVGSRDAVPAIAAVMQARSLFAWRKAGHLKRQAVSVLASMRTPEARQAIYNASRQGDLQLKRTARAALRSGD